MKPARPFYFDFIRFFALFSVALSMAEAQSQGVENSPSQGMAPPRGLTLSLQECLDLTLKHHPRRVRSEGSLQQAQGSYRGALSSRFPQIDLRSGLTRGGQADFGEETIPGSGQGDATSASLQAQASQNIWDFGRRGARISGALRNREAAAFDAESVKEELILGALEAYYGLWQAASVQAVDREALQQARAHLQQAQVFLEAGRGTRYEVVKAEVNVENARLNVLRSENGNRLAKDNLEAAMGIDLPDSLILADSLTAPADSGAASQAEPEPPPPDAEEAARLALRNRPETKAARLRLEAARQQSLAAYRASWPSLAGQASYGLSSRDPDWDWQGQWQVGLSLGLPVFDGGSLRGSREQADGSLKIAEAGLTETERDIALDARQQAFAWKEADLGLSIAMRLVAQAALGLELSQARYKAGVGNYLELTDAELAYSQARIARIQSLADRRIARARLQRAIGTLP